MRSPVLSSVPPMLRMIVAIVIVLGGGHLVLLALFSRGHSTLELPAFVPMLHGPVLLASFSIAFLSLGRWRVVRDPQYYWVGVGFAAAGVTTLLYILAWPDLTPRGTPLFARFPGTASWILKVTQATLGLSFLAAGFSRSHPKPTAFAGYRSAILLLPVLASTATVGLILLLENYLSDMVIRDGEFTFLHRILSLGLLLLFVGGAFVSIRRQVQSNELIPGLLALVQVILAFSEIDRLIGERRYDLWWYLARLSGTGAHLLIMGGLLADYIQINRKALNHEELLNDQKRDFQKSMDVLKRRSTELHETVSSIEAERHRLQDVLDELPAYIVLLDAEYHVPYENRFFKERFGRADGRRCYEYLFNRTEPCEVCESFTPFRTGISHEWEWTGPDGRIYEIHDFPFADPDGTLLIMEVGFDITDRRAEESESDELRHQLEQTVALRTEELSQIIRRLRLEAEERQRAEEAVQDLALFPEENPFPVLRVSLEGKLLYANRSARPLLDRWGSEVGERVPPNLAAAVAAGVRREWEAELEGSIYWFVLVPLVKKGYSNLYALDISEWKKAEAELGQTSARLEAHMENSPLAIIEFDAAFRVTRWSGQAETLFGWTAAEVVGRSMDRLRWVHEDDLSAVRTVSADMITGKRPSVVTEHRNYCKNGSIVYCEWYSSAIYDHSGRLSSVLSLVMDVSGRRLSEARLRRLASVLEEIGAVRDYSELLDIIRSAAWELTGTDGVLLVRRDGDSFHSVDVESDRIPRAQMLPLEAYVSRWAMRRGAPLAIEDMDLPEIDGIESTAVKSLSVMPIGRVSPIGAIAFYWTKPHRCSDEEMALQQALADGAGVALANLELQLGLESARLRAERLAQAKADFLATMSHEIRTPLNGVLGMAQIGYRISEGRSRATFSRILESGRVLLGVINDILDVSRIDAGKLKVEFIPVDLTRIIDGVADLVSSGSEGREVDLRVDIASDLPRCIMGDSLRLTQILLNLLSNALKFSDRGVVSFVARQEGDALVFQVSDSGIGMSREQVDRLFVPFEQLEPAIAREFGGTGLGLAITRRLVELMNGEIQVFSRLGQGTTFEVRLPCVEAPDPPVAGRPAPLAGRPRLSGLRTLVVEDNGVNRLVLKHMLELEGARVLLLANGQEVVQSVLREGSGLCDIILMDVQMPVMDGLEATRRIREIAPEILVIGQTAHAMPDERERCFDAGMVDHLAKPVDHEQLVATILHHTGRRVPLYPGPFRVGDPEPVGVPAGIINWDSLRSQFDQHPETLGRLLQSVLLTLSEDLASLKAGVADDDSLAIAQSCHRVKGVAGLIHAIPLLRIAEAAEAAVTTGVSASMDSVLALTGLLDSCLDEIRGCFSE